MIGMYRMAALLGLGVKEALMPFTRRDWLFWAKDIHQAATKSRGPVCQGGPRLSSKLLSLGGTVTHTRWLGSVGCS